MAQYPFSAIEFNIERVADRLNMSRNTKISNFFLLCPYVLLTTLCIFSCGLIIEIQMILRMFIETSSLVRAENGQKFSQDMVALIICL